MPYIFVFSILLSIISKDIKFLAIYRNLPVYFPNNFKDGREVKYPVQYAFSLSA